MCMDGQTCHTKAHGSACVGQCAAAGLSTVFIDIMGCVHIRSESFV